jgi:hypothetical protein
METGALHDDHLPVSGAVWSPDAWTATAFRDPFRSMVLLRDFAEREGGRHEIS